MNYLPPQTIVSLPQGAFGFTPAVRAFGPHDNPQDLQDEINAAILAVVAIPDVRWQLSSVEFTSAQFANNTIHYSALLSYTIITVI